MKISICNFKSIKEIRNFEINFTTLLSGVNSSGKTSFIQLLLMLKQSFELQSSERLIELKGDYIQLGRFEDIIYNKDINKSIDVELTFNADELKQYSTLKTIFDILNPSECKISISLIKKNNQTVVKYFSVFYNIPGTEKKEQFFECNLIDKKQYKVKTNTFFEADYNYDELEGELAFISFVPNTFKFQKVIDINKEDYIIETYFQTPNFEHITNVLKNFFKTISYIGPLRETPHDFYEQNSNDSNIGTKGEYTAYFLEKEALNPIQYYKAEFTDEYAVYSETKDTLLNAVKYWLCEIFKLAKDIKTIEDGDKYAIHIINNSGLEVSIKHVGFGISQILPIIVEGLRMKPTGTLILEQPEIHLHPKIQSLLFDFLYSLTLNNKKIIIETHSDHLITRMRRRIAEDVSNNLQDKINLMFIEEDEHGSLFRFLDFNELGSLALNYYPKNFVEQLDEEYRAIVKAQSRKRLNNKK